MRLGSWEIIHTRLFANYLKFHILSVDMAEATSALGATVSNISPAIFPGPDQLTGRHVTLERLKESHIPALYSSLAVHADVWTYLSDEPFSNLSDFANGTRVAINMTTIDLYTVFRHGEAVGSVSFGPAEVDHRVVEVGMVSGPSLQRTREAREAMYLLIRLAFDELNYRRVEWKCDRLNVASARAAQKYGLVYEGCLRQHRIVKGRNRDTLWYSMLDSEWPLCKRALETWLDDTNFDEQGRQKRALEEVRQSISKQQ